MSDPAIGPVIDAWEIIEETLLEVGLTGPSTNPELLFRSQAEQVAKAIVARLAAHDPPILVHYAHEESE